MTKKQKKTLKRIIISAVLYLAIILASKLVAIPWYLELVLFLVPYFIIGHDVLWQPFAILFHFKRKGAYTLSKRYILLNHHPVQRSPCR